MSEIRVLAKNVIQFLDEASAQSGRIKEIGFSQEVFCELIEGKFGSPIEDMFYIACKLMCESCYTEFCPTPQYKSDGTVEPGWGLHLSSQEKIGKYRVDFVLRQYRIGPEDILTPLVVELDGHEFHDKNKIQRAYEKSRGRFLVKSGFRVIHFTGSEVVADPYCVAFEALSLMGLMDGAEYDKSNPFGIE